MIKVPKAPIPKALDEVELDDEALDRVIGGVGGGAMRHDADDGWATIVEDPTEEVPAKIPPLKRHRDGPGGQAK